MTFNEFLENSKIKKWGKYVFTLLAFLIVFLFIGDQSLIQFARRGREIRQLEQQRDAYREGAKQAQRDMQTLNHPDSLERFAREQYFMHEQNEDVYLIEK